LTTITDFCKRRNLTLIQLIEKRGLKNKNDLFSFTLEMGLINDVSDSVLDDLFQDSKIYENLNVVIDEINDVKENIEEKIPQKETVKTFKKNRTAFTKSHKEDKGE